VADRARPPATRDAGYVRLNCARTQS